MECAHGGLSSCVHGRLYMGSLESLLEKMSDVFLLQRATISSVFHSVTELNLKVETYQGVIYNS